MSKHACLVTRGFESLTAEDKRNRYCGICYFHETTLTASVYLIRASTPHAMFSDFEWYFKDHFKSWKIKRIEVLPQGFARYDERNPHPVLFAEYDERGRMTTPPACTVK